MNWLIETNLAYYFHKGGFIEEFLDKVDLWKSQLQGGPTVRDEAVWSQAAKDKFRNFLAL